MSRSLKKWFESYMEYLSEYETSEVRAIYLSELAYLHLFTGTLMDLKTKRGRIMTILIFIGNMQAAAEVPLLIITAFSVYEINNFISYLYMSFAVAGIIGHTIYFAALVNRRRVGRAVSYMSCNFSSYDFENLNESEKISGIKRNLKKIVNVNLALISCALMIFVFTKPIMPQRYVNGVDFSFLFPMYYPFQVNSNVIYYLCTISQIYSLVQPPLLLMLASHAYISLATNTICQLQRLIDSIDILEKRAKVMYEKMLGSLFDNMTELKSQPQFIRCLQYCLRENIDHHEVIINYFDDFNSLTTMPFFIMFVAASYAVAFGMVLITHKDETLVSKTLGVCIIIFSCISMFVVCTLAEKIPEECEKYNNSLYNFEWYHYNKRVSSYLKIMLPEAQKTLRISAFGIITLDMVLFGSILQTAYSTYNILNALQT